MPNISVIMPVYNQEKYLNECLDSVLRQTFQDIEIICVDDGSSDSSPSILKQYAKKDSRVRVLFQENQGAGSARNHGFSVANGKYVIFLDSDDIFEEKLLEKLFTKIEKTNSDVVVCRSDRFNQKTKKFVACPWTIRKTLLPKDDPFSSQAVQKDFFMMFVWWPWDKLYCKSYIERIGIQFQNLRTTNDLFFVAGSVLKADRITHIDDVLVHHRVSMGTSLSVTREKSWDCFYKALIYLREYMKKENLYERFEQDFMNYCLHFSLWNLETLHGYSYCLLYNALRNEWYHELGLTEKPAEYFFNQNNYAMMRHILQTDLDHHLSQVIIKLEEKLERHEEKINEEKGTYFYRSRLANAYMRVKLYYKGYGFVNTVKKILQKLTE